VVVVVVVVVVIIKMGVQMGLVVVVAEVAQCDVVIILLLVAALLILVLDMADWVDPRVEKRYLMQVVLDILLVAVDKLVQTPQFVTSETQYWMLPVAEEH
jgi:hypothetical protein